MPLRFDGPHKEILVVHPTTRKLLARVKRGENLPDSVPAEIVAELAARDNWTKVDEPKSAPKIAPKNAPKEATA